MNCYGPKDITKERLSIRWGRCCGSDNRIGDSIDKRAGGLIPGVSDDSTISRYIFGTTTIPLGLAWSWLSILALLQTSDKRY